MILDVLQRGLQALDTVIALDLLFEFAYPSQGPLCFRLEFIRRALGQLQLPLLSLRVRWGGWRRWWVGGCDGSS